jgi:microcystin-dependent protein
MTIAIKHAFVSLTGDGTDATQVQPSHWNASHSTSMASGNLLGRLTAGVGVFEEIPISAYMANLLSAADQNALAGLLGLFETGDIKYTFKTTASAGWLLFSGGNYQIGNAGSGANLRANADTQALFTIIYNSVLDVDAPVSGGRGASAAADFAANKTLTIPNLIGRSLMGAGPAARLMSARVIGREYGEETHTLIKNEMPQHFHGVGISDTGHTHGFNVTGALIGPGVNVGGGGSFFAPNTFSSNTGSSLTGVRCTSSNGLDTTDTQGGGLAHNNVGPVMPMNVMVKL